VDELMPRAALLDHHGDRSGTVIFSRGRAFANRGQAVLERFGARDPCPREVTAKAPRRLPRIAGGVAAVALPELLNAHRDRNQAAYHAARRR
jgi:hypothetical protein